MSVKKVDGKLEFFPSIGGLATGLATYTKNKKNKWIGWPGIASDELTERDRVKISEELQKHNCYPVFLTQKQLDEYYSGYCNGILWPLFHYNEVSENSLAHESRWWMSYLCIIVLFADTVFALSGVEDTFW
ncbi:MAG: trehalose-6-phosphate synthase, partial [Candidatus Saccharimonadales bacterium]